MVVVKRNQSVARAFAVIEYLADHGKAARLVELAHDLHLDHATAHRFLSTLRELGYVRQDRYAGYQLTLKFAQITSALLDRIEVRALAHGVMTELSARTSETCHLALLDGVHAVYIDKTDGNQAVSMRSRVGSHFPLHSTATGKVILAYLPKQQRTRLLTSLQLMAMTPNTITDRRTLEAHLSEIRETGYAVDNEENEKGIRCVAAPILDSRGELVASMSVSGWIITITPERAVELSTEVIQACGEVSSDLGPSPSLLR
jgi:IclR family acetate operon transcriptional repressor